MARWTASLTGRSGQPSAPPDLPGYVVVPALINAHDHLELNHFPRTTFREGYPNAHEWGEEVNTRLDDPPYRDLRAYPLRDRLFIGGLKNLLSGALTVAHHNPPHHDLFRRDYPVRVLRRYGWVHSLHFNTDDEVVTAYKATPKGGLFFIHLAEGTDTVASREYRRLKALGCVGSNTVLIHGVGLTAWDIGDAAPRVRALVTCPTTNCFLLGRTANLEAWRKAGGRVWIGSDSRLTATGDLLDEINALTPPGTPTARALQSDRSPSIKIEGAQKGADYIILREGAVTPIHRADLALVVRSGVPQIGDPEVMARFVVPAVPALLDGKPKLIHRSLAAQIKRCSLQEPGLSLE